MNPQDADGVDAFGTIPTGPSYSFTVRAWKCPECRESVRTMYSVYNDGNEHQLALICYKCETIFTRFKVKPYEFEFERKDETNYHTLRPTVVGGGE